MLFLLLCHALLLSARGEPARETRSEATCDDAALLQVHQEQSAALSLNTALEAGCPAVPDVTCHSGLVATASKTSALSPSGVGVNIKLLHAALCREQPRYSWAQGAWPRCSDAKAVPQDAFKENHACSSERIMDGPHFGRYFFLKVEGVLS